MGEHELVFPVKTADPRQWGRRARSAAAVLPALLSLRYGRSICFNREKNQPSRFDSSHVPSALRSPAWRFTRCLAARLGDRQLNTGTGGGTEQCPLLSGRAVYRTLMGLV